MSSVLAETEGPAVAGLLTRPPRSLWSDAWRRLIANRLARLGMAIAIFFLLLAIFVPVVFPYNARVDSDLMNQLLPPSSQHLMGTDEQGRDVMNRIGQGARASLGVGISALSLPDYRGSDESSLYAIPFPYLVYRGTFLKADRNGIRGTFFGSDRIELNLSLGASLPVSSDDNPARQGMPDLQPTVEFGPALDLNLFARSFLAKLSFNLGLLYYEEERELRDEQGSDGAGEHRLLQRWRRLSDTIGRRVVYGLDVLQKPQYRAVVEGISDTGGIVMRLDDGHEKTEYCGEIRYL